MHIQVKECDVSQSHIGRFSTKKVEKFVIYSYVTYSANQSKVIFFGFNLLSTRYQFDSFSYQIFYSKLFSTIELKRTNEPSIS